jgi:signal transduction histidine kinase
VDDVASEIRLDATGAFAHDMRTPLTSIVMVLDLARSLSPDGDLAMDDELEAMLRTSVDSIHELVDDFHESSRIARSLLTFATAPTDIQAVLDAAAAAAVCSVSAESPPLQGIVDAWDEPRLTRAICQLIDSTDRLGDGSKTVAVAARAEPGEVVIELASGFMEGEQRAVSSDAGYFYFHGCQVVEGIGGSVVTNRVTEGARLTVTLFRN